ncbi:MAG TPA: BCAM0308 family protein [Deltaproteobacteria bacterium]|nr:BCAM0308 family protein [Deltaproteobacteria bacterium]
MRMDRNIREKGHDPYAESRKHAEGVFCPECRAVYREGRWVWPDGPVRSESPVLCSACRRVRDGLPAGELRLTGAYFTKRRGEIMNLVDRVAKKARERSPLKRVMAVVEEPDAVVARFTDDHLARHVAQAVHRAFKGELEVRHLEEERFVRLVWRRDA